MQDYGEHLYHSHIIVNLLLSLDLTELVGFFPPVIRLAFGILDSFVKSFYLGG